MDITVEHAAMQAARADVIEASRRLHEGRSTADRRMRSLLAGGWTGDAAVSVREAWDDWTAAATRVADGLEAMEQLLGAAHRDLVAQDEGSQRALDAISQRIVDRLG